MKNELLAVLATFGLVASASAVKINDNISINGFIDGSYSNVDADGVVTHDETNVGIDEVEVNILVNAGNVSGELHLDSSDSDDLDIGKFTSPTLGNGLSVTAGQFGSALGFEREDPAGLYTYSRAYGNHFDLGNVDDRINVQEGVRLGCLPVISPSVLLLSTQLVQLKKPTVM